MADGLKGRPGAAVRSAGRGRPGRVAMAEFLDQLAATSNVAASARAAGMNGNAMYRERRRNAEFAARWHAALCEGFARLEAELLAEALVAPSGNVKDATLKSRAQKYRLGLALLAAHRAAVRGQGGAVAGPGAAGQGDARERLTAKLRTMQARVMAEAAGDADADGEGEAL